MKESEIKRLYIIGNGFDCYGHCLPTKYSDFSRYLKNKYPNYVKNFQGTLESIMMPDGDEQYNMDEAVGAIIFLLDNCAGDEWNLLETCLSDDYIRTIIDKHSFWFNNLDTEDSNDDDTFHNLHDNEDMATNLSGGYLILKKLFIEWVQEALGNLNYEEVLKILTPSFENSLFLSFNYTDTLEAVYDIDSNRICHIHGSCHSEENDIFFGHGGIEPVEADTTYWGIQDAFEHLWNYLKKDTNKAISRHMVFFHKLSDVKEIYSYGFSFSDVDMVYIEMISMMVNPSKVKWFFNKYDWDNNYEYVAKIQKFGYSVCKTEIW